MFYAKNLTKIPLSTIRYDTIYFDFFSSYKGPKMGLESAFCDFFAGENRQAKRNLKIKNKYIYFEKFKNV